MLFSSISDDTGQTKGIYEAVQNNSFDFLKLLWKNKQTKKILQRSFNIQIHFYKDCFLFDIKEQFPSPRFYFLRL